jgi:hypothetical protein
MTVQTRASRNRGCRDAASLNPTLSHNGAISESVNVKP